MPTQPLIITTPLKASNINLFKAQSDILVADGYMYFQGTDQAIWRVNANLTDAIFDFNNFGGPGRIKTKSNVFPSDGFLYFRGTDDKVWQMSTTEPYNPTNLGGFKTHSNIFVLDRYMYFQGTDQAVWRVSVINPTTDNNNFGGPNRIKTQSSIFVSGNHMYFQDVFPFEDYIYFQGTDHAVWRVNIVYPTTDNNNFGGPNRIKTQSNVYAISDYMYFRGTDNKVWQMYMEAPYNPVNVGPMTSNSNIVPVGNAIYFQGTDNKVWCYNFEVMDFSQYIAAAVYALQEWYDGNSGQWKTTGFWNSANALYTLIDFARSTGSSQVRGIVLGTVQTTFEKGGSFINNYTDDEGWWTLAWINAYDLSSDEKYLNLAKSIFGDINSFWDEVCNGGIWWQKDPRNYKNAIANELYTAIAAKLCLRSTSTADQDFYGSCVRKAVTWFSNAKLFSPANLINDGLTGGCTNNNGPTWTYNQGVIIGALCDINSMNDPSISWNGTNLLDVAMGIANAVIATSPPSILNKDGILIEPGDPSTSNSGSPDAPQFKGIFIRNLARLVNALDATQAAPYVDFINNNVMSILDKDRDPINQFGYYWGGPFDTADAARQSCALDALNAAIAVRS